MESHREFGWESEKEILEESSQGTAASGHPRRVAITGAPPSPGEWRGGGSRLPSSKSLGGRKAKLPLWRKRLPARPLSSLRAPMGLEGRFESSGSCPPPPLSTGCVSTQTPHSAPHYANWGVQKHHMPMRKLSMSTIYTYMCIYN